MEAIFPDKLQKGDTIMVVAPSDSLALISDEVRQIATERLTQLGLKVVYAQRAEELNAFDSSSIESRVADLHEAFADPRIKGIFTAFGGYNSNQLLSHLDWNLIQNNPKMLFGFSDTTALQNAIFAKTGLVTYSGPSYSRFGQKLYFEYTLEYFKKCAFDVEAFAMVPSESWSDDWWYADQEKRTLLKNEGWYALNGGEARGTILGGNLCTLNLLQGTEYFPDISNAILFLEDDGESKFGNFDRDVQSLLHLPQFKAVRGIVFGRFQHASGITTEQLVTILNAKQELQHIPILAGVDFGHTDPMCTFPIGGEAEMHVSDDASTLRIVKH